jgi:hypothetical protein
MSDEQPSARMREFARRIERYSREAVQIIEAAKVDGWTQDKLSKLDMACSCATASHRAFEQALTTFREVTEGRIITVPQVPGENEDD